MNANEILICGMKYCTAKPVITTRMGEFIKHWCRVHAPALAAKEVKE